MKHVPNFPLLLVSVFIVPAVIAPLPMDWRRPTAEDIAAAGKWKIKPVAAGGHKGIIRVRVKDLNHPGEQYTLRVTVTHVGSGEETMIEPPPLTTEIESIA